MTILSVPLLASPYLGPADAARLAAQNSFLLGFAAGVLAGWACSIGAIAVLQFGGLPW